MKKVLHSTNSKIFDFYTYGPTGKDVIIPIHADTEELAWDVFEYLYEGYYVDQVIEQKV